MKLLVDMNLSPMWVSDLERAGHDCIHWKDVGAAGAPDTVILTWARFNDRIVLTHDLDFGAILAATARMAPSVIQLRLRDPVPESSLVRLLTVLETYKDTLFSGALISVDEGRSRVRVLPIVRRG